MDQPKITTYRSDDLLLDGGYATYENELIVATHNHPNLIPFVGVDLRHSRLFSDVVTELDIKHINTPGEPLEYFMHDPESLKYKFKSTDKLLEGLYALCGGIAHLNHWLIHRDIKAENTLLSPDGRLIAFDYGLVAKPYVRDQVWESRTCTQQFAAPEQWASDNAWGGFKRPPCGYATDVFGLAMLTLNCVRSFYGQRTFTNGDKTGPIENPLITDAAMNFKGFPKKLQEPLQHATQFRPWDRFPAVNDFASALKDSI